MPNSSNLSGTARSAADDLDTLWINDGAIDPGFVPAAEVFSASGTAIWDGLRTVRGLWVAHPSADKTRKVRIRNSRTGAEIDGVLYPTQRARSGDLVTLSFEAATSLGLTEGNPTPITILGLRPVGQTSVRQRRTVATRAETELASHIARLDDSRLVQVAAAAMRGMGYATIFEDALVPGLLSGIRAFPRPDLGYAIPAIRVSVRPAGAAPMSAIEVRLLQDRITGSGDLGAVISLTGFDANAPTGLSPDGAHVELVDLEGLMNIWITRYEQMSPPDRALLELEPVYFLATR